MHDTTGDAAGTGDARADAPPRGPGAIRAILFDADGADAPLDDVDRIDIGAIADTQLLWIDVPDAVALERVRGALGLPEAILSAMRDPDDAPDLIDTTGCFWVRVRSLYRHGDGVDFRGRTLRIVAGANHVLTMRDGGVGDLDHVLDHPLGDTGLGALDSASFVASLLHRVLKTYFDAVGEIEMAAERIEQSILDPGYVNCTAELRGLLRASARVRRMLATHRGVFTGLARPDFRPMDADGAARRKHFAHLDGKFEHAIDATENCRDLVIGSFELFSSRTALSTNETMRRLTFVTMLVGVIAVSTGALGMNYKASFFESADRGFWMAVSTMGAACVVLLIVGKLRRWL